MAVFFVYIKFTLKKIFIPKLVQCNNWISTPLHPLRKNIELPID